MSDRALETASVGIEWRMRGEVDKRRSSISILRLTGRLKKLVVRHGSIIWWCTLAVRDEAELVEALPGTIVEVE